jgi:hypothetical protein
MIDMNSAERARTWLDDHCHSADVRSTLLRAVEYVDAVDRAGLEPGNTAGDDLYAFLTSPEASEARIHSFLQPTL